MGPSRLLRTERPHGRRGGSQAAKRHGPLRNAFVRGRARSLAAVRLQVLHLGLVRLCPRRRAVHRRDRRRLQIDLGYVKLPLREPPRRAPRYDQGTPRKR